MAEKSIFEIQKEFENKRLEKLEKFNEILKANGFIISGNQVLKKLDNGKLKVISNFIPFINKKIYYTNGNDLQINYQIKAIELNSKKELPEIIITKQQYYAFNFIIRFRMGN